MEFVDVVFPLNLGPLTYRCNPGHGPVLPGMVVRAEVKKRLHCGVVFGKPHHPPSGGDIKEIIEIAVDRPVVSETTIRLFRWMAKYYLAPEGIVLKRMVSSDLLKKHGRPRKSRSIDAVSTCNPPCSLKLPEVTQEIVSKVRESLNKGGYTTYLFHAPSTLHEIALILTTTRNARNILILVPEASHIELFSPILGEIFGERLTILHGRILNTEKKRSIERLLSGDSDIVLGTRMAVSAPLKSLSCIAVIQEQNRSYKNIEGVRYHARDVAVMRGFLERSLVILSSTVPSIESFSNTLKGKYTFLKYNREIKRPRIDIIDTRHSKMATPSLSYGAIHAASKCMRDKENVIFLINRKGYSMIKCAECDEVQSCLVCRVPLIYHRDKKILRCNSCDREIPAHNACMNCHSRRLEPMGSGTQRITFDLKRYLGIDPLRFDRDVMKYPSAIRGLSEFLQYKGVVVGTKAMTGTLRQRWTCKLCVFLNPDTGLHQPDFRSSEFLFQEIVAISEYVKPEGRIMLQTRMPENEAYKYIQTYRFTDFFMAELARRASLLYPPYSKMFLFTLASKSDLSDTIMNSMKPLDKKVEAIGPLFITKKGIHLCKVIVKSTHRENLYRYAQRVLEDLKKRRGLRISVDVDPIVL